MRDIEGSERATPSRKRTSPVDDHRLDTEGGPSPKKVVMRNDPHRETEESHFYELYAAVLWCVQRASHPRISDDEVSSAVEEVIGSFRRDLGRRFSDVDFARYENVCAYLFRYSAHGAGLVRCKVLEAAGRCKQLDARLRRKGGELRVVSLGGGPGNDAIGFCSALAELGFLERRAALSVTVVDAEPRWEDCVNIAKFLARAGRYGDVSEIFRRNRLTVRFECAKLPEDRKRKAACYRAIRGADVILMTKLLSIVEWEEKAELIQDVCSTMKDTALLLFIDSPFSPNLWDQFRVLYLSEEVPQDERYRLLEAHNRFGSADDVTSKARIAVLCKKQLFPQVRRTKRRRLSATSKIGNRPDLNDSGL